MAQRRLSYTDRDFESLRQDLINYTREYYPELIDNFNDASVFSVFLDLNAAIGDNLNYHIDRSIQETVLQYAQQKSSIYNIARTYGLKIPGKNYGTPIPMTEEDILDVIDRYVFTAKIARETGFTGVQFHSAHGYLLSEFLSPDINNRTDAWGGSLENRARIHIEIINKCRKEVGEDFPISVKLNSADFQKGGFTSDESIQVAKMLEDSGVDIIEISGGTYEQPKLIGVDDLTINPKRSEERKESTIAREAYFLEYAQDIRKAVSLPLMVTGGFRTKVGIEDALQSNVCQMVGIGRPLCADPYCIKKMIAGEIETLPSFEKTLSLGPSIFSPSSPFTIIKVINAFGAMAWFYQQIKNMAKGLMPNHDQKLFNAFRADMKEDKLAIKDYLNNN